MSSTQESAPVEPKRPFNRKIAIAASVLIILGVAAWYFLYFIKTPEYSLNLIKESVQKHDIAAFQKHVDLDSLLSRGCDDLLHAFIEADTSARPEMKKLAFGFIQMLKPTITAALKDGVLRYVETGEWNSETAPDKERQTAVNPDQIAEKAGMKSSAFRGINSVKKDGKTASVGAKIFDADTNKDYVLDIKMRELDDGTWQISEIANLKQYILDNEAAKKELLKQYIEDTQPLIDKNNAALNALYKDWKSAAPGEKAAICQNIQEQYKDGAEALKAVSIPAPAKRLADLREKSADLAMQIWQKHGESAKADDPKRADEIQKLDQERNQIEHQIKTAKATAK